MSNRVKVFWVSVGLIVIALTLVIGFSVSITSANKDLLFPIMAFISFIILVFICDGCKKYMWKEEVLDEMKNEESKPVEKQEEEKETNFN